MCLRSSSPLPFRVRGRLISASFFSVTFLGSPKQLLCNVAPLCRRVAHVRGEYFKPNESYFEMPGYHFLDFLSIRLEGVLVDSMSWSADFLEVRTKLMWL